MQKLHINRKGEWRCKKAAASRRRANRSQSKFEVNTAERRSWKKHFIFCVSDIVANLNSSGQERGADLFARYPFARSVRLDSGEVG